MSKKAIYLKTENITKTFHLKNVEIPVLKGVDLQIEQGEWVALLGASGSGKSTLLNILGLLERPDEGEVWVDGVSSWNFSRRKAAAFRRQKIGFIFQAYHLLPELTVYENIKLAGMINYTFGGNVKNKVDELLEKIGLEHRKTHRPNELSGGEQQRVAIARAVINSPDLILADEPTGNLDSQTGNEVLEIFKKIHDPKNPKTIIMVTHNKEVADLADRIVYLRDGMIAS